MDSELEPGAGKTTVCWMLLLGRCDKKMNEWILFLPPLEENSVRTGRTTAPVRTPAWRSLIC
jgi:hypothetical protein